MKDKIGKIYSIKGRYIMNVEHLEQGWRAMRELSGGGALVDMGYHYIDLLVWYMGMPQTVTAKLSMGNRPGQKYDVEDTVSLLFDYGSTDKQEEKIVGNLIISRVYPRKEEKLTVYGTNGAIELQNKQIKRFDCSGREIESVMNADALLIATADQLDFFTKHILGTADETYFYRDHFQHVSIIEAAYESDRIQNSSFPDKFMKQLTER